MVINSIRCGLAAAVLGIVSLAAVAAGCAGGQNDSGGAPLSLEQRIVRAGEFADWQEVSPPATIRDAEAFVDAIQDTLIAATPAEAVAELQRLGFVGASFSSLGKPPNHVEGGSGVIELGSQANARAFQDWAIEDSLSPCPGVCDIDITEFEVDHIPDAVGIKRERQPGAFPRFEYYEISFTDGPFYYVVLADGDPRHVSKEAVVTSAQALWDRVRGRPLPENAASEALASKRG